MEINKKKTFIMFLIINILIFSISYGLYYLFIDSFEKNHTDKYITNTQNVVKETTNSKILEVYNLFSEATKDFSSEQLNTKIDEEDLFNNTGFLYFMDLVNNEFNYNETLVNIDDSYLNEYNIGFFNKHLYMYDNNIVGIIDLNIFLERTLHFTDANDLLLMSNQGEIYFNLKEELYNNVLNEGSIENIKANNIYIDSNSLVNFYVGGVIGYLNNTTTVRHNIGLITNTGSITTSSLNSNSPIRMFVGGVMGYSSGRMYEFSNTYGNFTNKGVFSYENDLNNNLYVAGILNSDHSEAVEYVQLLNENDLENSQANTKVSPLINHLSNTKLTISQATSKGELNYFRNSVNGSQSQMVHGAIYTNSLSSELQLNYLNIETNLNVNYDNNSSELNIAGVTLNSNANFLNVIYGGVIQVEITENNESVVWVSGITRVLNNNKIMKNSLNEGNINVYVKSTNTNNSVVKNLYVGGLVNINEAGDLNTQTGAIPVATTGIINSINRANITSYFKNYQGIEGRINTFAGGISTINKGSIQDVVNTGNIRFSNITEGTQSQFVNISSHVDFAGKTEMYKTGVVIGGISSVVTSGHSRIYDSINNGNILAQSYYYARSGGILGIVSPFDVSAGDVHGYIESNDVSLSTHLKHSVISNGINYGNIYAITSVIGSYGTGNAGSSNEHLYINYDGNDTFPGQYQPSINMSTRRGSLERVALHSAAGGIIGSGLSVLERMLNHGEVAATDAAGGIIGSIFVYTEQYWRSNGRGNVSVGVTIVNINTAINYGEIRAVKIHSSGTNNSYFNSIYNYVNENISEISNVYYNYNDDFIIPTNPRNTAHLNSLRLFPEHKRGIGGVIGRIQRGGNQNMITNYVGFTNGPDLSSEEGSFDFIVNMNENVDLIGRLDQNYNFSLSRTAFQFYDAIYYSAKENDTTQAVFTGFELSTNYTGYFAEGNNVQITTRSSGWWNPVYHHEISGADRVYENATFSVSDFYQVGQRLTFSDGVLSDLNNETQDRDITNSSGYYGIIDVPGGKFIIVNNTFNGAKEVPYISETPSSNSEEYVYHEDFIMRDENTTLTTGESITSYIYYAEYDLLADRFQLTRPNGMYVLSTTAGSTYGSVLPRNFNVNKLSKILPDAPNDLNYENVSTDYLDVTENSFTDLLDVYKNQLYQTKLNDKSALLEEDQYIVIEDDNLGVLSYDDSSAEIDYENKTIIFDIDRLVLGSITSIDLKILEALIPDEALIAKTGATQVELETYRNNNPNRVIATGSLAPNLSISGNPQNNIAYEVGKFTSYSEAAIKDDSFTNNNKYYSEYTIYIRIVQANQSNPPYLHEISEDGGAFISDFTNISVNDYLTMKFRDQYDILSSGHVIDNLVKLYFKDNNNVLHEVEEIYYDINSIPKQDQYFETILTFNNLLRNGTYVLKYKIYNAQTEQELEINYDHSRTHEIYDFKPYTNENYDGLTADFSFGHNLDFLTPFTEQIYENKVYLARYNYNIPFLEIFSASSFFEIDNINVVDVTGAANYKRYQVDFNLIDGTTITKYLEESELAPTYYKDNVRISSREDLILLPNVAENFVTREAQTTTFSLRYNMENSLYDENNFVITLDNSTNVTTSSTGVYYNVSNDKLNIIFTESLLPGDYEVKIEFDHNGILIPAGNLIINKRTGTRDYLNNIKFSEFVPGIEYPLIYAVNNDNTSIIPQFEMGIYYQGIDYHQADQMNHKHFRIDGEVSGVPLNLYRPINITQYLPLGGKIQRKYYDENGIPQWSNLVDQYSTEQEINDSLSTDFTVDPETGVLEYDEFGNPILPYIEYRVVSEKDYTENNYENGVTYFMSVRDIEYSFLAVFTYVYYDGVEYQLIDNLNKFNEQVLILDINNYNVKKNGVVLDDDYIVTEQNPEPTFDEIINIKSSMTQFYKVVKDKTNSQYIYGLGTNFSGYYHFSLDIDKEYYIREGTSSGEDLTMMSENIGHLDGYYYYINASPITRTRYFTVVITDNDITDKTWGLTSFTSTTN